MPMTTTITSTAPITIATVAFTPRNVAGRSTMRSVRSVRVSTWGFVDGGGGCAGGTLESPWGAGRAGLSGAGVVVVSAGAGGAAACCALTSSTKPPIRSRLRKSPAIQLVRCFMRFIGDVLLVGEREQWKCQAG